jgi:hypothetical protein
MRSASASAAWSSEALMAMGGILWIEIADYGDTHCIAHLIHASPPTKASGSCIEHFTYPMAVACCL